MRRSAFVLISAMLATLAVGLIASEKPSAEYSKAMKDLGGIMGALSKSGASEDFELAKKSAVTARESFAVAQKYWAAKGVTDAVKLADAGTKAAADLAVVAGLSSSEGVEAAVKDLAGTCAACHTAHREKMPDGSFEIK